MNGDRGELAVLKFYSMHETRQKPLVTDTGGYRKNTRDRATTCLIYRGGSRYSETTRKS